jgi:hypothetical protein
VLLPILDRSGRVIGHDYVRLSEALQERIRRMAEESRS